MLKLHFIFIQLPQSSNLFLIKAKYHTPMNLILPDKSKLNLKADGRTIEEILLHQGIDPLTTLVSRGDEIIPEDTIPEEDDTIRIIQVSHGG